VNVNVDVKTVLSMKSVLIAQRTNIMNSSEEITHLELDISALEWKQSEIQRNLDRKRERLKELKSK